MQRTLIKKFSTKAVATSKGGSHGKETESDLDLEEEFTSTPPPLDIDTGTLSSVSQDFFTGIKSVDLF